MCIRDRLRLLSSYLCIVDLILTYKLNIFYRLEKRTYYMPIHSNSLFSVTKRSQLLYWSQRTRLVKFLVSAEKLTFASFQYKKLRSIKLYMPFIVRKSCSSKMSENEEILFTRVKSSLPITHCFNDSSESHFTAVDVRTYENSFSSPF